GAGSSSEGPQDAANELKAALARGEFPCVGATTHDEFRRHVQGDPALERRFVPVLVREPTARATVAILRGAAARYEEHHGVRFRRPSRAPSGATTRASPPSGLSRPSSSLAQAESARPRPRACSPKSSTPPPTAARSRARWSASTCPSIPSRTASHDWWELRR